MFEKPLLSRMEDKPARLTILIDAEKKRIFDDLCAAQDITASQVVRQLIRAYLQKNAAELGAPRAPITIWLSSDAPIGAVPSMELKTARLTVLIDPAKKEAFEDLCRLQDMTPSQVVRRLIRDWMQEEGGPPPAKRKPAAKKRAR